MPLVADRLFSLRINIHQDMELLFILLGGMNFEIADIAETKRFHLFKSLVYKNENAQNKPLAAHQLFSLLFNSHRDTELLFLLLLVVNLQVDQNHAI